MKKNKVSELYDNCGCLLATLTLIGIFILAAGLAFGIFCFEGWIFMLLWNWLAVELFSAPLLSYWICVGIVAALTFIAGLLRPRVSVNTNYKN